MRYDFDTEFLEGPAHGGTLIQLISIGIIAEDGRELYLENADFDWHQPMPDTWLHENVLPHLDGPGSPAHQTREQMRNSILAFIGTDPTPDFWAYVAAYDWIALIGLFGRLVDRPDGWPSMCHDLKQAVQAAGLTKTDLPPLIGDAHNPLHDARWNRTVAHHLATLNTGTTAP